MSDLTELIKAERSAADLYGYYGASLGTGADYRNAKAATDAAIANLAAAQAVSLPDRETVAALLGISDEYFDAIQGGEHENWSRLIDHLWKVSEALKALSFPPAAPLTINREALRSLIAARMPGVTIEADTDTITDAVLAALSTQPAAGDETSRGESDCFERTGQHALRSTYAGFHCTCGEWRIGSWNGADEAFAEHVEAAEPSPELAELFPGTLAALEHLSIRPEVQS